MAAKDTLQALALDLPGAPGQPALRLRSEFRTFTWRYADLARDVRTFGHWLDQRGLNPGDRVLLWAPSSPSWAVAFLASLAAGLVVVPLDLHSAPDFVARVGEETQARLLLAGRRQVAPNQSWPSAVLETAVWQACQLGTERRQWPVVSPDDLAEIVYTSGTTSQPRGVMLTHGNLLANLSGIQPVVPSLPDYHFLSVLPLSHVFEQVIGLLLPLSRGGRVTYVETLKPSALLAALRAERPNVIVVVPRLLALLRARILEALPEPLRTRLPDLTPGLLRLPRLVRRALFRPVAVRLGGRLAYVVVGGAPLDRDLEDFWNALGPLVLQGYGLTEAGPVVTANTPWQHRSGSVGRPIAGVEVRLGMDGEVLVRSPSVMAGYYARPELTAGAIVGGFLRTGDVGAFDRDGFLFLRGRQKDLIVTAAGLNVYPEDVESALNRQPGLRDSAVLEWNGKVFAVLLLDPRVPIDPAAIVQRANRQLNPVQRVQGWSVWPGADFPRTPSLKIQKYKVREALAANLPTAPSGQRPIGQIAQIVRDLTPSRIIEPSSRLGDDLELSSIDRLELIALLEEAFHVDLPEAAITPATTVADLDRLVHETERFRRPSPRLWPLRPATVALRAVLQQAVLFPVLRRLVWLHVEGEENLRDLPQPVVFAGNHVSHLDAPVVLLALPAAIRRRTAVGALATFYFPPATNPLEAAFHDLLFDLSSVAFNTFPVPRARGFRDSLRYVGFLVDHGWNILIFPEGTRSPAGTMLPFREGIGLLATELQVPVVPFYLHGTYAVQPRGAWLPWPGPVTLRFGAPMRFPPQGYWDVTHEIEAAVGALAPALELTAGQERTG
jgi:long-chain acyl-CoA synthetase